MTIKVVLVDDQALIRSGLAMVISSQPDFEIVAECGDGDEVLPTLRRTPCDIVVMDIRMPRMDGVTATRELIGELGDAAPKVLILTTFDTDEHLLTGLQAGASGFLLKGARPEELIDGLRSVASGDAVLAPSATRRLLERFGTRLQATRATDDRLASLTEREREVLDQVCNGASNAEISERLFMAEGTVKTHIGRLLHKTQSRDRVGLVLFAHEMGLLD